MPQDARRHFERWSRSYDASVLAGWFHRVHAGLLADVDPPPGARVLDLGCGTGEALARLAASRPDARRIGVDMSRGMLAAARAKGHDVVQADAHHLPVKEGAVDVVLSSASFHHYEDPDAAAREIARILRPSGEARVADADLPRWLMDAIERTVHAIPFRGRRAHRSWQVAVALRAAGLVDVVTRRISFLTRVTSGRRA